MAITAVVTGGTNDFAVLELNNVAFRRDGRVEAQCALSDDFADATGKTKAENGMILAVDKATNTIKLPTADSDLPLALHYSTEHMYDEREESLSKFYLVKGMVYPRLGYLSVGDLFTTNAIAFDSDEFADEDRLFTEANTKVLYGKPCTAGAGEIGAGKILVTETKPEDGSLVLKVVKNYTVPNGKKGFKFQVIKA